MLTIKKKTRTKLNYSSNTILGNRKQREWLRTPLATKYEIGVSTLVQFLPHLDWNLNAHNFVQRSFRFEIHRTCNRNVFSGWK